MAVAHRASATFASTTGTTGGSITIPAGVQASDDLYVLIVSRDHLSGTALPTCTDSDTGGNTWTRLGGTTDRKANLFWKKATGSTASKTVTIAGAVGSCTGGLSAFSGGAEGDPTTNLAFEDNASGNESHAGFTPANADSMICFGVLNATNDTLSVTVLACTNPGSLEPELWSRLSTGGSDCYAIFTARAQSGGPTATGNFTWAQTNSATKSVAFAVKPQPSSTGTLAGQESGSDAAALAGTAATTGALSATEPSGDTAALAGATAIAGTTAAAESGADVFAGSGTVTDAGRSGDLAATESGADTAAAAGFAGIEGTFAAAESGTDQAGAAGAATISGSGAAIEAGADAFAAAGTAGTTGALAAAEAQADVAAIIGAVPSAGLLGAAESGGDTFAGSGTVAPAGIIGSMAATETGPDAAAIAGLAAIVGAIAASEIAVDRFAASGTVSDAGGVSGALDAEESGQDEFDGLGRMARTGLLRREWLCPAPPRTSARPVTARAPRPSSRPRRSNQPRP